MGTWDGETPQDAPGAVATPQDGILACAWGDCGRWFRPRQTGHRFCSATCRSAWWDVEHPRLKVPVGPRAGTIKALILGVLQDGAWHDVQSLAIKTHSLPCSVSARIRELRQAGHQIERDLKLGNSRRPARYRLLGTGQA